MRRREFTTLVGGAAAAWPLAAHAQRPGKVWRIGFPLVVPRENFSRLYAGFHQGMQELGYVEGKDFIIEWRSAEGTYERLPEIAAELVRLNVDIIVTGVTAAIRPLQQATSTIPIVMAYSVDPVGNGFVASLARPGGNITGLTGSTDDTAPKQLELLAAVVVSPSLTRRVAAFAAASSKDDRAVGSATVIESPGRQTDSPVVARSKRRRRRWFVASLQVSRQETVPVRSLPNSTPKAFGVLAAVHGATQLSAGTRFAGLVSFATNST